MFKIGTIGLGGVGKPKNTTEIALPSSNLYLVGGGVDRNGNNIVKLKFPNSKTFSIQTTGALNKTKTILKGLTKSELKNLSKNELQSIANECISYIIEYGTASQKKQLKTSKGLSGTKFSGDWDAKHTIKLPTEEEFLEEIDTDGEGYSYRAYLRFGKFVIIFLYGYDNSLKLIFRNFSTTKKVVLEEDIEDLTKEELFEIATDYLYDNIYKYVKQTGFSGVGKAKKLEK